MDEAGVDRATAVACCWGVRSGGADECARYLAEKFLPERGGMYGLDFPNRSRDSWKVSCTWAVPPRRLLPPPEPRRLHVGLWRERAAIPAPMASSNARHGSRTGNVRDLDTVAEFLVRFTRSNFPGGLQLPPPRAVPRAAPFALPFALRTPGGKSLTRGNLSLIGLCARRRRRNCATCWCSVNSGIRSF
jgi:hypothetical protein